MTDDEILSDILRREGGYVWHSGEVGPTNMGITQTTLAEWRGTPVKLDDMRLLSVDEAKAIYRAKYLAPFRGAPEAIRPQLVDIAVLQGVTAANQLWARAGDSPTKLLKERLLHFARVVQAKPTKAKYLVGWISRATEFLPT